MPQRTTSTLTLPVFLVAMGCTPAHLAGLAAAGDLACATGTVADLLGAEWGSVLERIACRLAQMAQARLDRIAPDPVTDAAEVELEAARDACDPEPTEAQRKRAIAALVACDGLVSP